jgi:hypothetical protein
VKRYVRMGSALIPCDTGDVVLYADHLSDRASMLAKLRLAVEAMEADMDEWDWGIKSGDITCSDEYRWVNKGRYEAALAACRAVSEAKR